MGAWDNLSIREKADMMKAAIRNGITTLPEIKQAYNEFAEGGNIYDGTKPHSSQMQKKYIYDVLPGLFAQDGVKISVTSGYRPGAVVRGTNKPSRHGLKQAADIVGDFDAIRRVLDDPNSNTSKWLLANGYGYLDETSKTGTSKFWHDKKRDHSHYHIGTDSGIVASYAKKMQKLLSELPQQQETVSMLPTAVTVPEFIPYNPQAFFGQQEATVQMPIESVDVTHEETVTNQEPTEQNNNFGTFSTIMGLLNAATPQESVPVMAQAQAKASSPYIVNRFDKGGSKKSGGSFYQTHRARWFNFLRKKGVDPVKAERLASYFSAQDSLESGHGTSDAAKDKNNFGGMQYLDKKSNKMVNISYPSIDAYMNAKWKMMNSRFGRALNAKNIQEYSNLLNDPKYHGKGYMYALYEGYRDGKPLDVARQTQHMNNYTRILMDIAGEKGFKGAPVPEGIESNDLSIVQPENPYTQFIPFEPFNPQAFNSPQAFVAPTREQFEVEQPIVEAAKDYAYSPEQLEREERRQGLNNLSFILGMMNGGNGSSFADTIGMLTGNMSAEGGKIYIKPENRGKFTALKKRTGHSATWFKEHGTPAQKKMATFALNSRHWKHGYGGHIYDGTTEDSQQMNIPYAGELPDVTVMPRRIANKSWDKVQERWIGDMPTYYAVNPETGKEEMLREIGNGKYSTYDDRHVFDVLGAEVAKKEREQWIRNGGNAGDFDKVMLGTLGLGLAPIALPEIAAGVSTALANPYVDAGLTSYFGAHGLNHAINEGIDGWEDAAMTALEVAPLGRLAMPLYEGVVQPGMRLFNSPLTGKWTTIGNKQYRLSPNSLGANGSPIESRKLGEYSTGINLNKMRSIFEDYEKGLTQYKGSKSPSSLEYNYEMPKIDFNDLVKDDFAEYLSQQTGRKIKRVPIKDTKHSDIYNEGFAFVDDEGKELAYIAGRRKGGKNVWVESSYVDPEFRYKGIGKQMYFDLNDHVFSTYGTTLHSDPMQRVGNTGVGMSPSNRLWKSLRDNGISTVEGEGFNRYDIMAEPSKIATAYRTSSAPQITAGNESVQNESIKDMFRRILSGKSDGIKTTKEMAEMGRKDLLDEISSPWYKERWKKATNGNDKQIDDLLSRMRVRITDVPMDYSKTTEQLSGKPGFATYGATVPREPHKFKLFDGTPVTDYNTGLDVQIASDRGVEARNTAYHELQHYLTNKATGTASYPSLKFIANGPHEPLITPTSDGELLIGRGDAWQHFIMDQNEALLPEKSFVYEEAMHSPQKLKKRLVEIGRTPEEADDLILKLKDEAQDMMDIQEERAHLKTWFTKDVLPFLKNPNDASEIERVLAEHPDIMKNRPEKIKTLMESLRPGSVKDYAKYLAESLGIVPFIVNTNSKEK